MPNWCENSVTLKHKDSAMIQRAYDAFERNEFLNEFIPVPQDLVDTISGSYGDQEKQRELREKENQNQIKYGYSSWYGFCLSEWGTKWDVGSDSGCSSLLDDKTNMTVKKLQLSFDSAWSPPLEAYSKLLEMGFEIEAYYHEMGMCFCGSWINGEDCSYDIPSTSQEAYQMIPSDIDDMFNITGNMLMWEEEEKEEEEEKVFGK